MTTGCGRWGGFSNSHPWGGDEHLGIRCLVDCRRGLRLTRNGHQRLLARWLLGGHRGRVYWCLAWYVAVACLDVTGPFHPGNRRCAVPDRLVNHRLSTFCRRDQPLHEV